MDRMEPLPMPPAERNQSNKPRIEAHRRLAIGLLQNIEQRKERRMEGLIGLLIVVLLVIFIVRAL